jgi:hypothetical protein
MRASQGRRPGYWRNGRLDILLNNAAFFAEGDSPPKLVKP